MGVRAGLLALCLFLTLLPLAATVTAGPPRLVRGGDAIEVERESALMLHAGSEGPTTVRLYTTGPEGARPVETDHVFRSLAQWTRHPYALSEEAEAAEVRPEGGVWVASGGEYSDGRQLVLDCASVGDFVYWDVRTEEVQVLRDDRLAPQLRLFRPLAGPLVPDELAVREHTMLLDGGESPLYFEVVSGSEGCAGTATLVAGSEPGASPLAGDMMLLLQALGLFAAALGLILGGVWWVGRSRDRQRRAEVLTGAALLYGGRLRGPQMWRPALVALLFVSLALFVPMAGASAWGVHEVGPGGTVALPGEGDQWVCVWAERPGEVVLHQEQDGEETTARTFTPMADEPDCRLLPGGALQVDEAQEGLVRVLVLAQPPQPATSPGVVRLGRQGVALALDRVTEDAELGVLPDGDGVVVRVVRADDLNVVATVQGPGEERLSLEEAANDAGVWVVLVEAPGRSTALVDWEDPNWFAAAPTIGHMAVVVAVALFLILYRGRSPRRLG